MGKGKSSNKNLKKQAKALKSLEADQAQSPAPDKESVKILKNVQKQLDEIVLQRETASKKVKKLDKETKLISKQVAASESQFSKLALNKDLQRIKASLEKKNNQFEKESTQLSSEILQFKNLTQRVENKIRILEGKVVPSSSQFQTLNDNNNHLLKKISNFEEEINQFLDTYILPDEAISDFSTQLNRLNKVVKQATKDQQKNNNQINQLQTDTKKLRESFQQESQHLTDENLNLKKGIESHQQEFESHQQEFKNHQLDIKSNQQELLAPLESHLHKLEKSIQLLQQEYTEHLQINPDDNNSLSDFKQQQHELSDKFNQFTDQLSQSQAELKQHLEQTQKSEKNDNSSEKNQCNEALEKLSLQLSDVTEQSNKLQALFDTVQEEQTINNDHHDELSKQYLLQQQQLDKYESQLLQLPTLIALSESSTKHIETITDSLEQLSNSQNDLSQQEIDRQSKLQILEQKIDDNQEQHQENLDKLLHYQQNLESKAIQNESYQRNVKSHQLDIDSQQQDIQNLQQSVEGLQQEMDSRQKIMASRQDDMKAHQLDLENHQHKAVSHQQDQFVSLSHLSEQVKQRSQIFAFGLVAVLGVSTLLYFTQGQHTETEELITQIKTDITNETFTKINVLTKQNSAIINQKFIQLNDSIQQISLLAEQKPETIDIDALKNTWQEQYAVLQQALSGTQTKQQALNQTVIDLSETINSVTNQYQLIQKKLSLKAESALLRNNQQSNKKKMEITSLNNTPSFYAIQLLGALQKESVMSYIKQHHLTDTTRIHQAEFQGKPWYILVQGHYSSFTQAKEALQQLPDVLQKNAPWIKKLP